MTAKELAISSRRISKNRFPIWNAASPKISELRNVKKTSGMFHNSTSCCDEFEAHTFTLANHPSPRFFVSVDSKALRISVNPLESTLTGHLTSVDSKAVRRALGVGKCNHYTTLRQPIHGAHGTAIGRVPIKKEHHEVR